MRSEDLGEIETNIKTENHEAFVRKQPEWNVLNKRLFEHGERPSSHLLSLTNFKPLFSFCLCFVICDEFFLWGPVPSVNFGSLLFWRSPWGPSLSSCCHSWQKKLEHCWVLDQWPSHSWTNLSNKIHILWCLESISGWYEGLIWPKLMNWG